MKNRTLLALATATLLTTPAFAATHDNTTDEMGTHMPSDTEKGATDNTKMQTGTAASTGAASGQSKGSTHMGAARNSGGTRTDADSDNER